VPRLNPIRAVQDWSAKKRMKAVLLQQLKLQPAGGGVEVPTYWCGQPNCHCTSGCTKQADTGPLWAAAAMELVREHAEITIVRMRHSLVLARRREIDAGLSNQLRTSMRNSGALPTPEEDIVDEF